MNFCFSMTPLFMRLVCCYLINRSIELTSLQRDYDDAVMKNNWNLDVLTVPLPILRSSYCPMVRTKLPNERKSGILGKNMEKV